jgi:uncharacterized protein
MITTSMRAKRPVLAALALLCALMAASPAQAAKVYFGTQDHLNKIQDVDIKGPNGEELYLGYKYSISSFIAPYTLSDDGYILGIRGKNSYFEIDDAKIKALQAEGQLPTPLPKYEISTFDYLFGHLLWGLLVLIVGGTLVSMRGA